MKKTHVLGVPVNITSYNEIINNIHDSIKQDKKFSIVSINLNKIIQSNESLEINKVIKSFDCFIPDGISVVRACKELNDRITGIDLLDQICKEYNKLNAKIFLYGATQEVVEATKIKLEEKYDGINIVGTENGFIKNNDNLINKINASKANIVFVAMGSPNQEKWICDNKEKLDANIFMGVGGAFDVISGKIKRAPSLMQKLGLEWLYRMMRQPKKRSKNIFLQLKYCYKLKKEKRRIR